jgi:hypothetical protein
LLRDAPVPDRLSAIDVADTDNALLSFYPEHPLRLERSAKISVAAEPSRVRTTRRRNRVLRILAFASGLAVGAIIAIFLSTATPRKPSVGVVRGPMHSVPSTRDSVAVVNKPPATVATGTTGSVAVPSTDRRTPPKRALSPSAKISGPLRGRLLVASQPAGAMVFINNEFAGQTPLVIRAMDIGSRAVRLRLDGYEPWSRGVRVVANESTTVTANLTRVTPAPSSRP